ncbi:MAG TPA: pirin family protein [Acidimicrobiales bacterium]|nr:pirin family protein [Acidimicrobiales bacterium]
MPAITVDNPLALPKLHIAEGHELRRVRSVTTAPTGYEGEGFPVRRAFAGVSMADLDPFIHMDQMGEVEYAPGEPKGTSWHPHRGFETVTYMIDGVVEHQDSNGGGGVITNGDTQWMTAGGGILHIERPPEALVMSGGLFHGLQLWVNLPAKDKMIRPRYQDIRGASVALLSSPDGGALVRLIAGDLAAHKGPGSTHTPISIVHATVQPGAQLDLPWRPEFNALVYVLSGRGTVGAERAPVRMGQLAVLGPSGPLSGVAGSGDTIRVAADRSQDSRTPALDVYVMGGRPIGEPVAHYGPFVMNTKAELIKAFEDYQAGRLGSVPVA